MFDFRWIVSVAYRSVQASYLCSLIGGSDYSTAREQEAGDE